MSNVAKRGKQVAFLFNGSGPSCPAILGGKGAGLVELARLGVHVPLGFTVRTGVSRAVAQHERLPNRLERQLHWQMTALEKQTGKRFGDATNPLLVSVRSGAAVSMPGMMDTVLNLGMNKAIAEAMAKREGDEFAYDCYRRFLRMYGQIVLGIPADLLATDELDVNGYPTLWPRGDEGYVPSRAPSSDAKAQCEFIAQRIKDLTERDVPEDPWQQLMAALVAVLLSWNSERAREYRKLHKIDNNMGTAVNVQAMVFGNRGQTSCTGVAFSHDLRSGEPGLWGEFLPNAQGEDVVAGVRTPLPIAELRNWNATTYGELSAVVERLEKRRGKPVDVEFTVESGKLFVLQVRDAKLTAEAAITLAVRDVWAGKKTKGQAVASITSEQIESACAMGFDPAALAKAVETRLVARGLAASPGAVCGKVVFDCDEAIAAAARGEQVVLVREDTKPEDLKGMMAAVAIVTMRGGTSCHAALVARDLGKPAVVGCGARLRDFPRLAPVSVDGFSGVIVFGDVPQSALAAKREMVLFLRWVREARSSRWSEPRLVCEMYEESVNAHQAVSDFYLTREMHKAAVGSQLEGVAFRQLVAVHTRTAERLATYLTIAVSGEIRHLHERQGLAPREYERLKAEYVIGWGMSSEDRPRYHRPFVEHCRALPRRKQIEFLQLAAASFEKQGWSMNIGGRKWAVIARAVLDFLEGRLTHTLFSDHAFDLKHNGGIAFDKNKMLTYDEDRLQWQLDRKKYAETVDRMYLAMEGFDGASPAVEALFRKGKSLGLWETDERLRRRDDRSFRAFNPFVQPTSITLDAVSVTLDPSGSMSSAFDA